MHTTTRLHAARWSMRLALLLVAGLVANAHGGAFLLSDTFDVDAITHPTGYTGTGGTLTITVCIDPTSPFAASMEVPVQSAIATWNALTPVSPNLALGGSNNLGPTEIDFESTVLHEMGHCIGLHHPNLSTESGLNDPDRNYTKTTTGANTSYDLNDGADNIIGSSDDARGDDVNLHWFRISNDNPFTIDTVVDTTTYSKNIADLPVGHSFPANADRSVGAALGFADSECVMQQGQEADEAQRDLGHDDVATLRLGMSGLDETEGTSDDYNVALTYGGLATGCDINAKFDDSQTAFAQCNASLTTISGSHYAMASGDIYFNTGFAWFFNGAPTTTTTSSTTTSTTLPPPLCGASPLAPGSCRQVTVPLKASFQVKNTVDPLKDQLKWKWKSGDPTALGDFKDPVNGSANMQLCVYDASINPQPLLAAVMFPGGMCGTKPCWKASGTTGYSMNNKAGTPQGLTKAKFKSGIALKAQVQVQGKGANLAVPAPPLTNPVTVQLLIDDGFTTECWQTTFTTFIKNDPLQYKAKGP